MRQFLKGLFLALLMVTVSMASYATPMSQKKQKTHGPPGFTVKHDGAKIFAADGKRQHKPYPMPDPYVIIARQDNIYDVIYLAKQKSDKWVITSEKKTQRSFENFKFLNVQKYYRCGNDYSA